MADIQAFRALRYDLAKVGSLGNVIAPPYDVIDEGLQNELYEKSDFNVVRLILNRGDDLQGDETVYDRAAHHLKTWRRDDVLRHEPSPAIYVYHQVFNYDGQEIVRRGFMARVRLEPFGEGSIYPHEETHSHAKEDRFKLMSACKANLSQIFSIYPDEKNEAQDILEAAIEDRTPITCNDHLGVEHRMWLVTDVEAIAKASAIMGPKPMYIADGHHRYETACNIKNATRESEAIDGDHAVDYVLMMCVSMHDHGMIVLPTHRLFRNVPPITSAEFAEKVGDAMEVKFVGKGPELAQEVWEQIAVEDDQSQMAFYCRADDSWVMAKLTDTGANLLKEHAPDQSDDWRSLGVSILHELVMGKLLGLKNAPPKYVRKVEELLDGLKNGDDTGRDLTGQVGSGEPFELACLVMPATVGHVKAISEHGERMPAKSTYFYPKMLSGMVINTLD